MDVVNTLSIIFLTLMIGAFVVFPLICLNIVLYQGAMLLVKKNKLAQQEMKDRGIK